jgi:hypothetical protein
MRIGIISLILLTGCSTTVPVSRKFPVAPDVLMERCAQLELLQPDAKLSDVAKNVTRNYSLYHECAIKNDFWQEWYTEQKKIFDEVK